MTPTPPTDLHAATVRPDSVAAAGRRDVDLVPGDTLQARYRAYRRRQVRLLLSLVPRDGLGTLRRLDGGGTGGDPAPADVAGLLAWAERLLPLPPFEVWLRDFRRHPAAHLEEEDPGDGSDPSVVDVRAFAVADDRWYASLILRPDSGGRWHGHVAFHAQGGSRSCTTGEIFREDRPGSVRERFREFDLHTLRAFLRSALP